MNIDKIIQELMNEATRRSTDFFEDSKYGKAINKLLDGKWNSKRIESFLDKLGNGDDTKYARILDLISNVVGLDTKKYKTLGDQIPALLQKMEALYKEHLSESVNEAKSMDELYADQIASMTGTRSSAVLDFINKHKLDTFKVLSFVGKNKSNARNFTTALTGTSNNPIQKDVVKMTKESTI